MKMVLLLLLLLLLLLFSNLLRLTIVNLLDLIYSRANNAFHINHFAVLSKACQD